MKDPTDKILPPDIRAESSNRQQKLDPRSQLFVEERVIFLGEVSGESAQIVIEQLLWLQKESPDKPITLYINSPGGSVNAGFGIYDTMNNISCPVHTVAIGMAASMGAFLLSAGEPGHRYALPNATIMIHQPNRGGDGGGTVTDLGIAHKYMEALKTRLTEILAANCEKPLEIVTRDCERDNFMFPPQALEYGLIDHIVQPAPRARSTTKIATKTTSVKKVRTIAAAKSSAAGSDDSSAAS